MTDLVGTTFGTHISRALGALQRQNVIVSAIKIKYPNLDPLLIVSAKTTEGPKICFIGGLNLDVVGKTFDEMVKKDAVPWKEDKFELARLAEMAKV